MQRLNPGLLHAKLALQPFQAPPWLTVVLAEALNAHTLPQCRATWPWWSLSTGGNDMLLSIDKFHLYPLGSL